MEAVTFGLGMSMQITGITIHPARKGVVGAYVDIVFDNNCLKVEASNPPNR
jgi:hypothetical protein